MYYRICFKESFFYTSCFSLFMEKKCWTTLPWFPHIPTLNSYILVKINLLIIFIIIILICNLSIKIYYNVFHLLRIVGKTHGNPTYSSSSTINFSFYQCFSCLESWRWTRFLKIWKCVGFRVSVFKICFYLRTRFLSIVKVDLLSAKSGLGLWKRTVNN